MLRAGYLLGYPPSAKIRGLRGIVRGVPTTSAQHGTISNASYSLMKEPSIRLVVRRFMEDGLAIVAAGQHVVGGL